jgi:aminopeptidase
MTDPRVQNLAKVLVNYSVDVQPGQWMMVQTTQAAMPLATEVVRFIIMAGGHATLILDNEEIREIMLTDANEAQLDWVAPVEKMLIEQVDGVFNLRSPSNTRYLSGIDPLKQRRMAIARRDLQRLYFDRAAQGKLRWVVTLHPCNSLAQEADMSLADYEDFVYAATFADQPDPVAAWRKVHAEQQRLVEWLSGKKQVQVRGPHSDLTLSIEGRVFINASGQANMPDGEIFTGPVEDSAKGWIEFTYPAIHQGREVEGIRLEFDEGKVIQATARKNQEYLLTMLDSDPGARYLGEFAIGTNYQIQRFTKSLLFDEKIGGSLHMAVGAGYPETGSHNQSTIHWDMICDMHDDSEILVDGELFYRNGAFQV